MIGGNKIFKGASAGIAVYDNGKAYIQANEIIDHVQAGVGIRSGSVVSLVDNKIQGGSDAGVVCSDGAECVITGNDITSNARAGVAVMTRGVASISSKQLDEINLKTF